MRTEHFLWTALFLGVLSGCQFTGKLTRRYKSATSVALRNNGIATYVGVKAYALEPESPEPPKLKTLFDLTERGQQEYLKQAAAKELTNAAYAASLAVVLSAKPGSSIELLDYTKFTKRIIVSVKSLQNGPADRIAKVDITLQFPNQVTLLSCNRLATEYQTLELGKLNYTNTNQAELTGNASTGLTAAQTGSAAGKTVTAAKDGVSGEQTLGNTTSGTSVAAQGLTAKVAASRTFAEEVVLRQRIVALNASIADNALNLSQEGISGINLTGNLIADLVFATTGDVRVERTSGFAGLQQPDGTPAAATKIKVKETLIAFPNYTGDIKGTLTYRAVYRKVATGDRTISESDDVVELLSGETDTAGVKRPTLIRRAQFTPKLSYLALDGDPSRRPTVIASPATGGRGTLIFASYTDARDFLVWVNQPGTLDATGKLGTAGHRLHLPQDQPFTSATLAKLRILPFL